ncbi:hypothetical protein RJ641_016962 [Dillenia turbinata]|uniref:Uncharacterized protein n=1 Tax=Dillenia turbinata TaxID=194707 RepID=A0AAN8Z035_9MAGN
MELCFAATKNYFLKDMRLGFASIIKWLGVQSVTIATAFGRVVRPTFAKEDPSSGHSYKGAQQILAISGTFVINESTRDAAESLGLRLSNGLGEVSEWIVSGPLIAANDVLNWSFSDALGSVATWLKSRLPNHNVKGVKIG